MSSTELSVGPFFNWFNTKCSDIWSSSSYFNKKSQDDHHSIFFNKAPICYWVYGAKNMVIWTQIQGSHIRIIDSIKAYSNPVEKVTTVSFARCSRIPRLFIGSDCGLALVYERDERKLIQEPVEHLSAAFGHGKKITSSSWLDSNNVFYSIDTMVVHWNLTTGTIEHLTVGMEPDHPPTRPITCLTISINEPHLLALGYEGGDLILLHAKTEMAGKGSIMHRLPGHSNDVCSLAFPWESGGYSHHCLASVSRDGVLKVWDLFPGRKIVDTCVDFWKNNQSKNRNFFALAFIPSLYNSSSANYMPQNLVNFDLNSRDNEMINFQLLISMASGDFQLVQVPKYPPKSIINRVKMSDFDRQKNYAHNNVVFNIAVLGPEWNGDDSKSDIPPMAISISLDRQAILWDLKEKRAKSIFPTFSHQIHDLAFNHIDPFTLAVASGEGLKLWKLVDFRNATGDIEPYKIITVRKNLPMNAKLTAVSWHPEKENQLAVGSDDGQIFVFDVHQSKPSMKYNYSQKDRTKSQIYTMVWGPYPSSGTESCPTWALYCVLSNGRIKMHLPSASKIFDFFDISNSHREGGRTEVGWRDDYRFLGVGNDDGTIEIYEHNPKESSILKLRIVIENIHKKLIQCLRWHPMKIPNEENSQCSFWLASASNETSVQVTDLSAAIERISPLDKAPPVVILEPIRTLKGHNFRVISLSWSMLKAGQLASCSYDCTVQIWDVPSGLPLANFRGHWSKLFIVAWSPIDPDLVYSGGDDNVIHLWRPSAQLDKLPPSKESSHVKSKVKNEDDVQEKEFIPWPAYTPKPEALEASYNEMLKTVNEIEINGPTMEKVMKFGFGGDIVPEKVKESANETNMSESNAVKFKAPVIDVLRSRSRNMNAEKKDKKTRAPRSFFPLTNVVENCSTKEEHFADIEYLIEKSERMVEPQSELAKRTLIYGESGNIKDLIRTESNNHREASQANMAYMMDLLQGNIQATIREAIKREELTDWLVAMSCSVSRPFWYETVSAYAKQLETKGEVTLAAEYLVSIYKVKEAIDLLIGKGLFKEALVLAKSRFPSSSQTVADIMSSWGSDKAKNGSYEAGAKCFISIGRYKEAADLLAKRGAEPMAAYFAALLTRKCGLIDKFEMYFGQAYREALLKMDSENSGEMEKILLLWKDYDERVLFSNFASFHTEFLSFFTNDKKELDFEMKLKRLLDHPEINEKSKPLAHSGVEYLNKFLGIAQVKMISGIKDGIMRTAFHLFSYKILKEEFEEGQETNYLYEMFKILHLTVKNDNELQGGKSAKQILSHINPAIFPSFDQLISDFNIGNIEDKIEEKVEQLFGFKSCQVLLLNFCLIFIFEEFLKKYRNSKKIHCSIHHHHKNEDDGENVQEISLKCDQIKNVLFSIEKDVEYLKLNQINDEMVVFLEEFCK